MPKPDNTLGVTRGEPFFALSVHANGIVGAESSASELLIRDEFDDSRLPLVVRRRRGETEGVCLESDKGDDVS